VYQTADSRAALVNEGSRFSQYYFDVGNFACTCLSMTLSPAGPNCVQLSQVVYAAETNVMSVTGIDFTRITQTNN
jgi:hypothetical protein